MAAGAVKTMAVTAMVGVADNNLLKAAAEETTAAAAAAVAAIVIETATETKMAMVTAMKMMPISTLPPMTAH